MATARYRLYNPYLDDYLSFNDPVVNNDPGSPLEWYVGNIDGWHSPDLRESVTDRPLRQGQDRASSFYGGRPISLQGTVISRVGVSGISQAKERIAALTNLTDQDGYMIVDDKSVLSFAYVRRSGRLGFNRLGPTVVEFDIGLYAADPLRYGQAESTAFLNGDGDSVVIYHEGNAPCPMIIDFNDDLGVVQNPSLEIALIKHDASGTIPQPGVHYTGLLQNKRLTLNAYNDTVLRSGLVPQRLGPGERPPFLAGGYATQFTYHSSNGAGVTRLRYRSAWL